MNKAKQLNNNSKLSQNEIPTLFDEEEIRLAKKYKPCDLQFKTPYGHLACMEWGNRDAPNKILCVHGWLDNAGSFERLIPFMLDYKNNYENYHIVAMDLPGVGLSSHLPPGGEYSNFVYIMEIRRITLELGWDKATFLVHSLGAHLTFLYSCIYPKQVDRVIAIDLAYPLTRQVHNWQVSIANSIEEKFKLEYNHQDDPVDNIRVPVYTETDALTRLMNAHSSSLTKESAVVLLKRGATKQSWGLTFNRDVRLRNLSLEIIPDDEAMLQYMSVFRSKLFIIEGKASPYLRPKETRSKFMGLFKKNCPVFRTIALDGTHHLHMNTPAPVAEEINKFLEDTDNDCQPKEPACKGNL